ncbi:MAG: prepilin-type N-terminal cleavage/methylation domain-containing protein [Piscirickettsiaceae bacterium]|nr:prepilin-type N-terminal cleavage/methylation domain-containing protein [Piscirickettsiaceae bacterium]
MQIESQRQQGTTLIELIIAMIIISVALSGILSVVNITTRHSADPVVQLQAVAIAESYLEEILLLPVLDPDGSNVGESRSTFDNIADYHNLPLEAPTDQYGNSISGLANYEIEITVGDIALSGTNMKEVVVNVSRNNNTITLKGYRANY